MHDQRKEEHLYNAIGQYLIDSLASEGLENKWDKVTLQVEFDDGMMSFEGNYFVENFSKSFGLISPTIAPEIEELKRFTEENNYTPWNKFVFELSPNFKFSIDYQMDERLG